MIVMLSGCADTRSAPVSPESDKPTAERNPTTVHVAKSSSFRVEFSTAPSPIPMNEPFEIRARVMMAGDKSDGVLRVDAAMPAHRHGMNTQPRTTREPDGSFLVRGMLLHMPGAWEIYFDLERDGETERAQYNIELE